LDWNSIGRTVTTFAMYIALMGIYFAGLSPVGFALYAALILGLGLFALTLPSIQKTSANDAGGLIMPSLSESMAQLHSLQSEINELQAQFSIESELRRNDMTPRSSAS